MLDGIDIGLFLLAFLIIFFAGVVQGTAGFGFGLVTVSLLGCVMDIKQVTIVSSISGLAMILSLIWQLRSHFRWSRIMPVFISLVIAGPAGVFFLVHADKDLVKTFLGIFLIGTTIYHVYPLKERRAWHPLFLGIPCGLMGGLFGGAFGTGGPPLVVYMTNQHFSKLRYAVSLQFLFLTNGVLRLAILGPVGFIEKQTVILGVCGVVFSMTGAFFGLKAMRRIPEDVFKKGVIAMLFLLGIRYLVI